MTAIATRRTCGTEPLENARFCHGCRSPVKDGDTRAEYKQVTVLFAACGTEPPPNDELTQAEWIDAARKAAFAERTPASPHQVKALAACIPDRFVSTTRSACGFRFVR
jgi:hypothetical protein